MNSLLNMPGDAVEGDVPVKARLVTVFSVRATPANQKGRDMAKELCRVRGLSDRPTCAESSLIPVRHISNGRSVMECSKCASIFLRGNEVIIPN